MLHWLSTYGAWCVIYSTGFCRNFSNFSSATIDRYDLITSRKFTSAQYEIHKKFWTIDVFNSNINNRSSMLLTTLLYFFGATTTHPPWLQLSYALPGCWNYWTRSNVCHLRSNKFYIKFKLYKIALICLFNTFPRDCCFKLQN